MRRPKVPNVLRLVVTGVMTFIVNRDGIVYQKDLGPKTARRANALAQYDPDETWKEVE